jgi:alpha-beta hydrolase superfamily lysophospholipase
MIGKYNEGYVEGFRGVKLFQRNWVVENPVANVIFLHGFGDHSARYGHFAAFLNSNNISFYTFDLRGHGKSEGTRWNVENFNFFLRDLHLFMEEIGVGKTLKNLFFIGYSMGSTILLKYLINYSYKPLGAILISPAFGAYLCGLPVPDSFITTMSRFMGPIARSLDSFASLPLVGSKVYDKYLTHNSVEIESFRQDPLVNQKSFKLRMGLEISRNIVEVKRKAIYLNLPILILFGKDDKIVPTAPIKKFFNSLMSKDKELIEYPELFHDLLHEIDYEKVYRDILNWIRVRIK